MAAGSSSKRPDEPWKTVMKEAWHELAAAIEEHPSADSLAAYAEGNLQADEQEQCEDHLSRCPQCLDLIRELRSQFKQESASSVLLPIARSGRIYRYFAAASLLIGLAGLGWGVRQFSNQSNLAEENARLKERLAETQVQLAAVYQENFLSRFSSGMRAHWVGKPSPKILELPLVRGTGQMTPEAKAELEEAKRILEALAQNPARRIQALLDMVFLNIVADDFSGAKEHLDKAQEILGDVAEVKNARAVWLLGKGDRKSVQTATMLLEDITKTDPDFLPAWFNLAILYQRTFQDDASRRAWMSYLQREKRPDYRKAANDHLVTLQN